MGFWKMTWELEIVETTIPSGKVVVSRCVCVCVSQTLFQREVRFSDERFHDFHDHHAGGHRKPIELCPTKLSMVSSGYQG